MPSAFAGPWGTYVTTGNPSIYGQFAGAGRRRPGAVVGDFGIVQGARPGHRGERRPIYIDARERRPVVYHTDHNWYGGPNLWGPGWNGNRFVQVNGREVYQDDDILDDLPDYVLDDEDDEFDDDDFGYGWNYNRPRRNNVRGMPWMNLPAIGNGAPARNAFNLRRLGAPGAAREYALPRRQNLGQRNFVY